MQVPFLTLLNKHQITPSDHYQSFWTLTLNFFHSRVCRLAQVHSMTRDGHSKRCGSTGKLTTAKGSSDSPNLVSLKILDDNSTKT